MKVKKNTLTYLILTLALLAFGLSFLPFAATIIVAIIFGLGISYWLDNVYIRYSLRKQRLAIFGISAAILVLIGTATSASFRVYDMTIGEEREQTFESLKKAKKSLIGTIDSARKSLSGYGVKIPPIKEENLFTDLGKIAQTNIFSALTQMGEYLSALTDIFINILVFAIFVMVTVRRRKRILSILSDVTLWGDLRLKSIYLKTQISSYASVVTIIAVGFVQTLVMTVGASIAGFRELSIVFIGTFFASFFPVLGTAPVGLTLAAIKFFEGESQSGFIMLGVATVTGLIDNWLKPYLVSHSGPQMNGFIALVGIIGAVVVFGLPGLFVGPFLMILIPNLQKEASDLLRSLTKSQMISPVVSTPPVDKSSAHPPVNFN